ncbi:MAG: F0F1 ATP synthase subunit A [Proteobacteria bacterium]|nr:F0F1 ATP synthase subunit A [Pseudomonadota bacterium]
MEHPFMILVAILETIGLGHFAHAYPHVLYTWLVMVVLIILAWLAGRNTQMIPGKMQNVFEVVLDGIEGFQVDMMGEEGRPYFPLIATIGIYIFISNTMGLIPGMMSPTSNINTTLSCAIVTFVATHYVGIKCHGLKYVKHFMGPLLPLAPLMIPIEIISHLARVLSLTLRLFGNIMGEDLVLAILFILFGQYFVPLPMMFLGLFTSFVQAFIFALLSMLYISGALEEAH